MRHILLNDNLSSQTLTCDFSGLSYSASLGSNNIFLSTDTGCKIIYKTENNKSYIVVSDKNTSTVLFEIGENDSTNTSPFTYDLSSDFGTVTTLNTDAYGYTNIHVDEPAGNSPVCLKPYETVYSTDEMKTGETWIDGKPIYRKTLQISNPGGTASSVDLSSLNIKNIFFDFSKSFYYWEAGNRILPLTSTNIEATSTASTTVSQNQTGIFYHPTNKRLYLEFGYSRKITSGVVTIEYTKTTD